MASKTKFEISNKDDSTTTITSISRDIQTAEDAFKKGGFDPKKWRIKESVVKSHEVIMKIDDKPTVVSGWNVHVKVERKLSSSIDSALSEYFKDLRQGIKFKDPTRKKSGDTLLEFAIYDAHFGKFCLSEETLTDYDNNIAATMFNNAVDDLIEANSYRNISRVLFPIGQDFFNVDNWQNTTEKGTPQDSHTRFPVVFKTGVACIIDALEKLVKIAPVDCIYVPGNHDRSTSWFLAQAIKNRFWGSKHILVDDSICDRKFYKWGNTMLMLLHAEGIKEKDLLGIAATTNHKMWGDTLHREAHMGHVHFSKSFETPDYGGSMFKWRRIASLCGTDRWHFSKGYVNATRCAESFCFDINDGYKSHDIALGRE